MKKVFDLILENVYINYMYYIRKSKISEKKSKSKRTKKKNIKKKIYPTRYLLFMSPERRGRGHIVFGENPVGIGVGVGVTFSCPRDILCTSGWILTQLARIH